MKIRLYRSGTSFVFGENLVLTLPSSLPPGPPELIWMPFRFLDELYGVYQYDSDGSFAVCPHPTGTIIPVRVQPEFPRDAPLKVVISRSP